VRTLEKLHEAQRERHREEQEQAAMKQLDEMALRGFAGEERASWSDAF
jgi:flagellar biosynthesis chaperone FliJ